MPKKRAGKHCTWQKRDTWGAGGSRTLWEGSVTPASWRDHEGVRAGRLRAHYSVLIQAKQESDCSWKEG